MAELIALMGLPGSGKSTLARALHEATGLTVVDRDAIRAAMFPAHLRGVDEKQPATEALWLALRAVLRVGQGSIVDGMTFSDARQRATARGLAEAWGACWLPVHVAVSQRTAIARVRGQAHSSKERTPTLVRQVAARFAPVDADTLVVDGTLPTGEQLEAVLQRLRG